MGTTVAGVVFSGREALVFNVGDSRAYSIQPGGLVQLSRDDTLFGRRVGSRMHSHALTQSLGGTTKPQSLQPHIKRMPLEENEALLLCSDGLTDLLEEDEIIGILIRHPGNPAEQLIAAALDVT